LQTELIKPAERGQVRATEANNSGNVRHVEVFQMSGVRTSIIGRPRPLPSHRRADQPYTLNCEESHDRLHEVADVHRVLDERLGVPVPLEDYPLGLIVV
jgi:hypothetical protein